MSERKMKFELTANQLKYKDILNKEFLELEIYAISDIKPNRNKTHFTLESMKKALPGFKNKPIIGFFENNDFVEHNGTLGWDPELEKEFWDTERGERVLGVIRESDPVEIVEKDSLHWVRLRCVLFVQYCYRQIKRLLKDRTKKVSVEITVHDSEVIDGIEEIYDFTLNGITILGSRNGKAVIEAIPDAHATILEQLDEEIIEKQKRMLSFAYQHIDGDMDDINNKGKEEVTKMDNIITCNKSVEFMSNVEQNVENNDELIKTVFAAENFKEVAHDIFLSLSEGWEDGDVNSFKYPVMEVKDGVAVYNYSYLNFAMDSAKENNDQEVVDRLNEIYSALGIGSTADGNAENSDNNQNYSDNGGDGESNGNAENHDENCGCPCKNGEGADDGHDENECGNKMSEDLKCAQEKCAELSAKCDEYALKCEEYSAKCEEYSTKCEEYSAKISELEQKISTYADYDDIKARMEKAEKTVWDHFCDSMKNMAKAKLGCEEIADEDRERIEMSASKGEYGTEEDLDRDIAYASYKARQEKSHTKWEHFNIGIHTEPSVENKTLTRQERLAKMANKK